MDGWKIPVTFQWTYRSKLSDSLSEDLDSACERLQGGTSSISPKTDDRQWTGYIVSGPSLNWRAKVKTCARLKCPWARHLFPAGPCQCCIILLRLSLAASYKSCTEETVLLFFWPWVDSLPCTPAARPLIRPLEPPPASPAAPHNLISVCGLTQHVFIVAAFLICQRVAHSLFSLSCLGGCSTWTTYSIKSM